MSELAMPAHVTDPITLEVIRQDLVSIPNQIDKNITRTAFSAFISEYKDYSVGIVDATGQSVSQSRGSLAIFVANALGTAVRDGLEARACVWLMRLAHMPWSRRKTMRRDSRRSQSRWQAAPPKISPTSWSPIRPVLCVN